MLCFTFWGTLFVLLAAALVCVHVPLVENDTPFAQVMFWWGSFVKYNFGGLLRGTSINNHPFNWVNSEIIILKQLTSTPDLIKLLNTFSKSSRAVRAMNKKGNLFGGVGIYRWKKSPRD
jgi:hypothetical protein